MNIKETIRAEIERRLSWRITLEARAAYNNILRFLDTLPEPVEGLEEAAEKHIRRVVDTAGHPGWDWETQDIADAFKAGAEWGASHAKTPTP